MGPVGVVLLHHRLNLNQLVLSAAQFRQQASITAIRSLTALPLITNTSNPDANEKIKKLEALKPGFPPTKRTMTGSTFTEAAQEPFTFCLIKLKQIRLVRVFTGLTPNCIIRIV